MIHMRFAINNDSEAKVSNRPKVEII